MKKVKFVNVWDALETDPAIAKDLKMRAEFMIHIAEKIKKESLTQQEAADRLKVSQPRVNALLKGKIEAFRLGTLITLAHRLNMKVSFKIEA